MSAQQPAPPAPPLPQGVTSLEMRFEAETLVRWGAGLARRENRRVLTASRGHGSQSGAFPGILLAALQVCTPRQTQGLVAACLPPCGVQPATAEMRLRLEVRGERA